MTLTIQQILTRCFMAAVLVVSLASCDTVPIEQPLLGGEAVSDSPLVDQVKAALKKNGQTTSLRLNITAVDDVIILRGLVQNDQQMQAAEQVASKVAGVRHVTNNLYLE